MKKFIIIILLLIIFTNQKDDRRHRRHAIFSAIKMGCKLVENISFQLFETCKYCTNDFGLSEIQIYITNTQSLKEIVRIQEEEEDDDDDSDCGILGFIPIVGSACQLIVGIKKGDAMGIGVGAASLLIDTFSFGGATRATKAATKAAARAARATSQLARQVQRGGKIARAIKVGSKSTKSLRVAARQARRLSNRAKQIYYQETWRQFIQKIGQNIEKKLKQKLINHLQQKVKEEKKK